MVRILLRKTWRDLRVLKAQTIALIVIVAVGVTSYVSMIAAYRDLGTSYSRTYDQLDFADVTFTVQPTPHYVADRLTSIDGVAAAAERLIVDTGLDLPPGTSGVKDEKLRARLIGLPRDQQPGVNNLIVLRGRYLDLRDSKTVLVESHFAQIYNVIPGSELTPIVRGEKEPLQVVGTVASPEYLIVSASRQDVIPSARTFAVLFMPLPELQGMVGVSDVVNDIGVRFAPGTNQGAVIEEIKKRLQPYGLIATTLQKDQPSNAALKLDLDGYREIGYLMPALILAVAAASLYIMLGRIIRSQQTQIGLMKALGYDRRIIVSHYLAVALLIGIVGSIVGVLLGLGLGQAITLEYADELGIPLVQTRFYPDLVVEGVLLSLIVAVCAGIVPALRAAQLAPALAMRPDPGQAPVKGGISLFERFIRVPLWMRFPLRNVFRVRARSASTALGIILAFVLILVGWSFGDSMEYIIQNTFHSVEQWDLLVVFPEPRTRATLRRIENWEGVEKAVPVVQLAATLKGKAGDEDIALTALDPTATLHRLALQGSITPDEALSNGHIILTASLANKFGLHVGDPVTLETPSESGKDKKTTRVLVVGGVADELMSAVSYISMDEAQRWEGAPEMLINGVYMKVDPAYVTTIKSDLYRYLDASSVQSKAALEGDWRSLMGLFYMFIGIFVLFAVMMAFALLFNAMTINVVEQQREFATMRAMGMSRNKITILMIVENVILWIVTLIPGIWLGTWAANQMGAAFQTDLFSFRIFIAPFSYLFTAIGILVTMILAALPVIRRVNRLNLAEATKTLT